MKKVFVAAVLIIGIGVCLAGDTVKKYWQDVLPRPKEQWNREFGKTDDSQLAYCIARLIAAGQKQVAINNQLNRELHELKETVNGKDTEQSNGPTNGGGATEGGAGEVEGGSGPIGKGPGDG